MTGQSDRSHGAASAVPDGATVALPGTLPDRPFGVHFRMSRWKSLVVLIAVPVILLLVQIIVFQPVVLIEGPADPNKPALTPLTIVATGLSTAITALLATVLVARMAKVPWRAVFRHTRTFDRRRVGVYLLGSAVLVGLAGIVGDNTRRAGVYRTGGGRGVRDRSDHHRHSSSPLFSSLLCSPQVRKLPFEER